MNRFGTALILSFASIFFSNSSLAQDQLSPFLMLDKVKASVGMDSVAGSVRQAITANGFEVLGDYQPGKDENLRVIVFTGNAVKTLALKSKDRGMLAAAQRIGLYKSGGVIEVSAVNPMYMFTAYFGSQSEKMATEMKAVNQKLQQVFKAIGPQSVPFGGQVKVEDLRHYHYMFAMPYFEDPIELATFSSFEDGVKTIERNLKIKVNGTEKVYSMIDQDRKIAVWGVGQTDPKTGEDHFLSIIGKKHVAAMPYEIILTGNDLTMLHGRFRFALYWPELTMGTFTKIMSTPGDVEETMKKLTE